MLSQFRNRNKRNGEIEKTYPTILKLTLSQFFTVDTDAAVPFKLGKQSSNEHLLKTS